MDAMSTPKERVHPIPDTYPRVSPHLSISGASAAIAFYARVLDAKERMRIDAPDGLIAHAEIDIGGSIIMIGDETPGRGDPSPKALGGTPVSLFVYVERVDEVFSRALQAGARSLQEPKDQFYGDRTAMFEDPFGHRWNIATHIEDVSPEEMIRRAANAAAGA
jgi:PhnB protein